MARYRVLEKSFLNFQLVEPGVEVDYDGKPDGNLEPLDDAAKDASEARIAELAAQRKAADEAKKKFDDLL